jgi:alanine dehydrogenase
MPLLLTEDRVKRLLTMPLAMELTEKSFRHIAEGASQLHSRQRLHVPGRGFLHYMAAADLTDGYMGLKIYTVGRGGARFLVTLFATENGAPLAFIEADYLGQMRTGAASGVATRYMARKDARVVGIIGTGLQARTQLEAVAEARSLSHVRVFGRDAARRAAFAQQMTERLKIPVEAVESGEQAVRSADIVITSTTSANPVLEGRWLEPGMHVNAIGSNFAHKRELDSEAVNRCALIVADSREQSKIESGDLILAFGQDASRWEAVHELSEVVSGKLAGRASDQQITMFKSNGVATEDIVVAGRLYELAKEKGIGGSVEMWGENRSVEGRTL